MDDAAKVAHQRVIAREIEVSAVGRAVACGRADEYDFADAFHIEAVGRISGCKDGLAGGRRGNEDDQ